MTGSSSRPPKKSPLKKQGLSEKPSTTTRAAKSTRWSSRFQAGTAKLMEDFHSSLRFDKILFREDIEGSLAHSAMLAKCDIIDTATANSIARGLKELQKDVETGKKKIGGRSDDIHLWVEEELTRRIGTAGKYLHTARSRNDQVSTDIRLYLRQKIDIQRQALIDLMEVLVDRSEREALIILPGHTHLQAAQVMTLGFYWIAYFFMFERDHERLCDVRGRVNRSPLGSGAFAGVNYPIDRGMTQKILGFASVLPNAMDAVSDRDFIAEYLSTASIIMMHLSRVCEDIIIMANPNFGFFTLADAYSSGSSIMPNKKNPDSLELIRGKSGRVFGHLMALLSMMKGLPLAYNRDLQEDKEGLFDTVAQVQLSLEIVREVIRTLSTHPQNMRRACERGFLQATDIADHLVGKGMPFRDAHGVSARLVRYLEDAGRLYADLSLEELKKFSELFTSESLKVLRLEHGIQAKQSKGSTGPGHVRAQLRRARKSLQKQEQGLKKDQAKKTSSL